MVSTSSYPIQYTQHQHIQYTQSVPAYKKNSELARQLTEVITKANSVWENEKTRVFIIYNSKAENPLITSSNYHESTSLSELSILVDKVYQELSNFTGTSAICENLYSTMLTYSVNLTNAEFATYRTPPASPSAASSSSDCKTP